MARHTSTDLAANQHLRFLSSFGSETSVRICQVQAQVKHACTAFLQVDKGHKLAHMEGLFMHTYDQPSHPSVGFRVATRVTKSVHHY